VSATSHWFTVEALPGTNTHTALVVGTHAEAVAVLNENQFTPVDVRGLAEQRLALGPYHQVAWTGSRTTDLLLVDGGEMYLAHGNPNSDLYATDTGGVLAGFHADNNEIPLDVDAITDSLLIPSTNFEIPVEDLSEHPVSQFLLGDLADDYQQWLAGISITHLPFMLPSVSLAKHYPYPFMRPLIMRCTDNWSGIITANADLHTAYGYRSTATNWAGAVQPEETFPTAALAPVRELFDLDDRAYTLTDLTLAADKAGRSNVLGVALRVVRSSSDLPASHATWQPDGAADE
jgi:hypothetical protein